MRKLYKCNLSKACYGSPWCIASDGPCECTADFKYAVLDDDGKPIPASGLEWADKEEHQNESELEGSV